MSTFNLESQFDGSSPRSSCADAALTMFADLTSGDLDDLLRRNAKLEQDNARLVAKCEQQKLFMAELGHRVRNSLTLVQAMVSQTLRGETSVAGAREALTARIAALGQSHAILIDESWLGASVRQVVEGALKVHGDLAVCDRFKVRGPAVRLEPQQVLALSMALHELGTNAAKYGALSVASGRVEVAWNTMRRADERWLQLRWQESGGPAVAPPTRRGFGSKLIEEALKETLNGEVSREFEPSEVFCPVHAHLYLTAQQVRQRARHEEMRPLPD